MFKKSIFLIVDDQKSITQLLAQKIHLASSNTMPDVVVCHRLEEVKQWIENPDIQIEVCLCDLNLPDAPKGETIDLMRQHRITTVVLSGSFNESTRQEVLQKGVADFVLKDSPAAIDYAVHILITLYKNGQRTLWLITSGQSTFSPVLEKRLRLYRYNLQVFETLPDTQLLAKTDTLPSMLVIEDSSQIGVKKVSKFISQLRQEYTPYQLPIMICESEQKITNAIEFMKYGANDFFNNQVNPEELYARLRQDIELSESYQEVEYMSQRDPMTGLFNRRHFFKLSQESLEQQTKISSAEAPGCFAMMIDIDHFKSINDHYGHQKGDEAIIYLSRMIEAIFKEAIIGRFGGEEFCIFAPLTGAYASQQQVISKAELLRKTLETQSDIDTGLLFTISLGVSFYGQSLEKMISKADQALYQSKENGRNQLNQAPA